MIVLERYRSRAEVVVVLSPQTPDDDPEKRLHTHWETCKFVDGLPKVQSLAVRVKGGAEVVTTHFYRRKQGCLSCPAFDADR